MHTPKPTEHGHEPEPGKNAVSAGYERSDVRPSGIVVFLTAMAIFVAVAGLLSYGLGKVINAHLNKEDVKQYGQTTRWAKTVDVRELGNMPSNPEMQNKMGELTESFPTPRVQTDDGNQDITDLHAREDLLLKNYSWADPAKGTVRIPIERAMALIAERGLPVAPQVKVEAPMTGDHPPEVTAPLTNGFARTSYEQEQARAAAENARRGEAR